MTHSMTATSTHTNSASKPLSKKPKAGSCKSDSLKSKSKKNKPAFDMYQEVTNQIIEALESGVKPWVCPWKTSDFGGLPVNFLTKNTYSGINILLLWASATKQHFESSQWLTFKQALELGGCVRKGEKGTRIVFYKMLEIEDKKTGDKENIPMLKSFTVFNVDQIDGLNIEPLPAIVSGFDALAHVEQFIADTGADIQEKGEAAYYMPESDGIILPTRNRFPADVDFYCTALHELVHWTGHKKRLNRDLKNRFGSGDYAFEELIAELGAAFLNADLGIVGEAQHESYIASWLKKLNNDKRYIFKAASAATKAHQFLCELVNNNHQQAA